MTTFVYLHGARATSASFNYIRQHLDTYLPDRNDVLLDYSSNSSFNDNLASLQEQLEPLSNLFFVGHSLGGVYALYLSKKLSDKTIGGITLSTPYGGSTEAYFLRVLLPFSPLMNDITPTSSIMRGARNMIPAKPWLNVVTTGGASALIMSRNDGVVTVDSMTANKHISTEILEANHYEVLLSKSTISIILNHHANCFNSKGG